LLSTTIISIVFLAFITTGLYNGWKLKDTLGNMLDKISFWKKPSDPTMDVTHLEPAIFEELLASSAQSFFGLLGQWHGE
jgi:hypothetical protein